MTHTINDFEKTTTSVWAEGSGTSIGCRATSLGGSAPANNETYFVFIISKTDGTTDFVLDTSETGANVLSGGSAPVGAGYVYKRCVGIVCTNGSGQVIQYTQTGGNEFIYSTRPNQHFTSEADFGDRSSDSRCSSRRDAKNDFRFNGDNNSLVTSIIRVRMSQQNLQSMYAPNGETQTTEIATPSAYDLSDVHNDVGMYARLSMMRTLASADGKVALYRLHTTNSASNFNAFASA